MTATDPHRRPQRNHYHTPLLSIAATLLIGFALRIYRLDAHELSADEAFSIVNWTRSSLSYLFNTIALIDPQPPATLLSLYGWVRLTGESELATRMLSALASTLTLAATYQTARTLINQRTAILALLITAITPFQIWYAQDVRSYALWTATSALSAWAFLLALHQPTNRKRWVAYTLTATAAIYTFYLEGFFLIAQNLVLLANLPKRPRLLKPWLASQLAIGTLLAPWFLRPSLRQSGYQPTAGPADIPWAFQSLLFGETTPHSLNPTLAHISTHTLTTIAAISLGITATALTTLARTKREHAALFLGLYTTVPITLLATLTELTGAGFFRPRYVAAASAPLLIATASLLDSTLTTVRYHTRTLVMATLTATILLIDSTTLWNYYFTVTKGPPWRDIVRTLQAQATEHDLVIRNYPDPAFDYYYDAPADAILLPDSPNPPAAETAERLASLLPRYHYIWFMPVPVPWYDGNEVVFQWLQNNAQLISEQWLGETHLLQYSSWKVISLDATHRTQVHFSDIATLSGYRTTPPPGQWSPGTTIWLETFWEPQHQTDSELKLFIHLLGPPKADGPPLWAQDDHPPQRNRLSTQTWHTSQVFRDVAHLTIPADTPPGSYAIAVGLYNPTTGERVPIFPATQGQPDSAILVQFELP